MELIRLTHENLEVEHICCAISNNTDCQVASKKAWLGARLDEGLVFLKGNVRGKCFIEYLPAEVAWAPINADGYLYIDCLWVSGQFKGQGYANLLLSECIRDGREKGKSGLAVLSSEKKRPFLADPAFLLHKGFLVADAAAPYFQLWYLPLAPGAQPPQFRPCCKETAPVDPPHGFLLYYTGQCPYPAKYVPLLARVAASHNAPFQAVAIDSCAQAQSAPVAFTTFALFYNGAYVTHEIPSEKRFEKLLADKGY